MHPSLNRRLHGLLNLLLPEDEDMRAQAKADMVAQVTKGRTSHSSEMTNFEAEMLIGQLKARHDDETKAMRGKIIHLLCLMGHTHDDGQANFDSINRFVQNIGNRNPRKVKLYWLKKTECQAVLNQIETMYAKELQR